MADLANPAHMKKPIRASSGPSPQNGQGFQKALKGQFAKGSAVALWNPNQDIRIGPKALARKAPPKEPLFDQKKMEI